jgi:hypothetical protein
LFSVSLMLFILQRTMLAAHYSSSYQSDLVVLQLQPMLLVAVAQQVLFRVVCRSSLMFHSLLEEAMAIPILAVVPIMDIIPPARLMVSHMFLMVKSHNSSQQYRCTMVARPQLEDMEVSDHSNRNNLTSAVLNLTLVRLLSQFKAWFLASH